MNSSKVVKIVTLLFLFVLVISCSTSQNKSKSDTGKNVQTASYPAPSPAPGTAEAVFKVLDFIKNGSSPLLDVHIISAGKFGSAVPPIPKGSGMKIAIANSLLSSGSILKGSTVKSVLSFTDALGGSPNWRVVKLLNQD